MKPDKLNSVFFTIGIFSSNNIPNIVMNACPPVNEKWRKKGVKYLITFTVTRIIYYHIYILLLMVVKPKEMNMPTYEIKHMTMNLRTCLCSMHRYHLATRSCRISRDFIKVHYHLPDVISIQTPSIYSTWVLPCAQNTKLYLSIIHADSNSGP
jgi:hypothetical protein